MTGGKREINIFNMSLLDILCGALGAFCFLTISLFDYYGNEGQTANCPQCPQCPAVSYSGPDPTGAIQALQSQVAALQSQLQAAQAQAAALQKKVDELSVRRPVTTIIWWSANEDIDVYVHDPNGNKMPAPAAGQKQNPYYPGDIRWGQRGQPGWEMWMMRDVPKGRYPVYAKLMSSTATGPVEVGGGLAYSNQSVNVGYIPLTKEQPVRLLFTMVMDGEGKLSWEIAPGATAFDPPPQNQK